MTSFLARIVIIGTIIVGIWAVIEFYLLQTYSTILVVAPVTILTALAVTVNIRYWLPKYGLREHISD